VQRLRAIADECPIHPSHKTAFCLRIGYFLGCATVGLKRLQSAEAGFQFLVILRDGPMAKTRSIRGYDPRPFAGSIAGNFSGCAVRALAMAATKSLTHDRLVSGVSP